MNGAIEHTATTEGGTLTNVLELPSVELGVADGVIAGLRNRLEGQKADSPAGYQLVRSGIAEIRTHRSGVERARKELKQSALEWSRKVDTEAHRVTDLLLEIENPLKEEKKRIDDEKERIKREKAEKIRLAQEAKERAEREAREKAEAAERESRRKVEAAEREQVRREQLAERKRLVDQRIELEKQRVEQAARDRAQQEKLAASLRQLEDARQALEREKQEVVEEARKKREAEEAKYLAIQKETKRKERVAVEERLAEELKPDVEKLMDFAKQIRSMKRPDTNTEWGHEIGHACVLMTNDVANYIEKACFNDVM